jgi:23S rRNA (uracil1939-C5)-methyltransferase
VSGGEAVIAAAVAPPAPAPAPATRISRRRRPGSDEQALSEDFIVAGTDRVTPRCAHFDYCGGCALQQLESGAQLRLKELRLQATLAGLAGAAPARWLPPIRGPSWGYRRRARLGVRFVRRKQRVLVGFRERHSNLIADLHRCEVLAPPVDALILPLCALVAQLSIRERLPQIEVAVADNAVALVLRVLEAPSAADLACLRAFEALHGVRLYLQPGGIDSTVALTEPAPRLFYALPQADLQIEFLPSDFIQVNASVNRELVAASAQLLQLTAESSLLDLYCGLGNFSLALARRARCVVGVEGDAGLVARARDNARRNGIANAEFFTADLATDATAAAWLARPYSHVLLDPPRGGAQQQLALIARLAPERVLYVSCNPESLARDIGLLVHQHGFELLAAGVVDMFPHTAHMESVALLAPRLGT